MRKLFTFALIAGFLLSCTSSPDPAIEEAKKAETAEKAKAEEHIAIVKKYLSASETGDYEPWRELCTDDYMSYGPAHDAEMNLDDLISYMNKLNEFTDSVNIKTVAIFAHTAEEGEAAGDYVLWWGSNSAYFIPGEKSFTLMIHTVFKMNDGKIDWSWDYWDTGDFEAQMKDEEKEKK